MIFYVRDFSFHFRHLAQAEAEECARRLEAAARRADQVRKNNCQRIKQQRFSNEINYPLVLSSLEHPVL